MDLETKKQKKIATQISAVSIIANLVLSVFKLVAGIVGKSGAMISDAVHSASDVISTVVVLIGVHLSSKEADKEHPYGHERLECVAAIVLSVILFATGAGIGIKGVQTLVAGVTHTQAAPGFLALLAAIVSIAVKESMYWFTIIAAKKINSSALKADAWHHRSDSLSSIGALVGIIGARMGYLALDSVASVVIALFVMKAAFDIFMDAVNRMVDQSCDEEMEESMKELILSQENVLGLTSLQTRLFGSRIYVDAEIEADGNLTLTKAHEIAENVHDAIEREFVLVKHCMVHVNPKE